MDQVMETEPDVPDGWVKRQDGSLIRADAVKPEHRLEDELVRKLLRRAGEHSRSLGAFRHDVLAEVDGFVALLEQNYETKRGGAKGNFTLQSLDGSLQVQVATGNFLTFGPELQVAKTLIDECITDWSSGSNDNIRTIVNDAFSVGKEGKLQVDRILALRRLNFDDPRWKRAMDAIGDAIRVTHSKRYLRFYRRHNADSPFVQVPLDVARV